MTQLLPPAEAISLQSLIAPAPHGIASRILAKAQGGSVTLFVFDQGQELTEHTSPFDALVMVLDGEVGLTVGGAPVRAAAGSIVRMPAGIPHALIASTPCRLMLVMLRDTAAA